MRPARATPTVRIATVSCDSENLPLHTFWKKAKQGIARIADYTIETFGIEQARRYREELEACFRNLAENPRTGRSAERLAPGLRRFEHRSHAVFHAQDEDRVLIVRVLHVRMDAPRHL